MVPVPDVDQVRQLNTNSFNAALKRAAGELAAQRAELGRPIAIGVSGYGGSGKSTTARMLEAELPSAYRLRGDDFLEPSISHAVSVDWAGVDRERLIDTVLAPFRRGEPVRFRRYDWSRRTLGEEVEPLPQCDYLIVDLVGLFHPDLLPFLDAAVWVDVDLPTATARGKARDNASGSSHDQLWDDVWVPNERAFERRYAPRSAATIIIDNRH